MELEIGDQKLGEGVQTACGAVWEAAVPRDWIVSIPSTLRVVLRAEDGSVTRIPAAGPAMLHELPSPDTPGWTA